MWRELLNSFIAWTSRIMIRLRYRIEWKGFDQLDKKAGVLFLPNHPAEIDPVIIATKLWPVYKPRPLVVEDFYYMPGVHQLLSSIRALPVPDMAGAASEYKRRRVTRTVDQAIDGLKSGDSVLLYPAGRLMRDTVESLGATSAVADIIQKYPDVNVCLVRTRGLMGSSFAWYTEKQRPALGAALWRGVLSTLKNLIFFNPRRPLVIEGMMMPDDYKTLEKLELNRTLEAWYNEHGSEEPTLISYSRWSEDLIEVVEIDDVEEEANDSVEIPKEVTEKVTHMLAELSGTKEEEVHPRMNLQNDLGFDSLNVADAMSWLEEVYFVSDVNSNDLRTVRDVMRAAVGSVGDGAAEPPVQTPDAWTGGPARAPLEYADVDANIPLCFLRTCDRMGAVPAVGDDRAILTFTKLKTSVLALARVFRKYPEKNLGVMLPASVAADVTIMAAMVAGKVPVMINWTLGDANLEHVLKSSEITRIITSATFLDKLEHINFDLIGDYVKTLETMRFEDLTLRVKLGALWDRMKSPKSLASRYGFDSFGPDDTAVILFTSGSESTPKGVPLSHRNVMSNFNGAITTVGLTSKDTVFGFLPPFHSFGFTVTTLMPLLTGMRACYHPNPTESRKLARGCDKWKPTLCAGTPTFFAGLFKAAKPAQLRSLRMLVSGAEKAPAELFEKGGQYNMTILEGYGITETAPVLTITPPREKRVGVGQPIGDVEILIVDENDRTPLPIGTRGLILAHGSNVFAGYLGRDSTDAFHEIDGKRYYVTGDLGFLDDANNLTIAGRLKRFVKIAGEMISLPAMEEALAKEWPPEDGLIRVAVDALEKEGERPLLHLFATNGILLERANAVLKASGFPNLARLSDVISLTEIPMLGTGKTDYQSLKKMLHDQIIPATTSQA